MAQPGPSAHLGHLSPAPRSPSAGAAQTTQDRPPSCPARSEGPLRRPRRRGSPRSTTRRNRSPRRHPPLAYSSNRLCSRTPPLTGSLRETTGKYAKRPADTRKVLMASTCWVRTQRAVEYGVKIRSRECDTSQCVLIRQHRRQVGKAARIPVPDLPRLLSLADQVGHQIHSVGVTAVDILGGSRKH